jgi:hypothetical protein
MGATPGTVVVSAREAEAPEAAEAGDSCLVTGAPATEKRWLELIDAAFDAEFEAETVGRALLKECGIE